MPTIFLKIVILLTCVMHIISAEAATAHPALAQYGKCSDIDDPIESINRKIFTFNSILDHFLLRPAAKGYNNLFAEETREKIGNALSNTKVPLTMFNNALQGEGHRALESFWKFIINSTFGALGTHDIAKARGIEVKPQTFGNTLAKYGFGPGPYIVLPFFGSTNTRDMWDSIAMNNALNPVQYVINNEVRSSISIATLVHERGVILPFTDHISKTSADPYIAIRSALHQRRESQLEYPPHYRCRNINNQ